jgi:DNA invertase Pin-like site-specific DNA recombinase
MASERRCYVVSDEDLIAFVKRVKKMRADGISISEIARILNISRGSVIKRLNRYKNMISEQEENKKYETKTI